MRCRTIHFYVTFILAGVPVSGFAQTGKVATVNVNVGTKQLIADDWGPLKSYQALGIETTVGASRWPIAFAADFFHSAGSNRVDGRCVNAATDEYALGIRKIFDVVTAGLHPQLGAGGVFGTATIDDGLASIEASGLGYWAEAGGFYSFRERINLGIFGRYSSIRASGTESGIDFDLRSGGISYGVVLGARF